MQRNDLFSVSRLLQNTPADIQKLLLDSATTLRLKAGQSLFERGDDGGAMYIVEEGRVEILLLTEGGRKVSLNLIGAGYFFGEISMADGMPRTASAVAAEKSVLKVISRAKFFDVAKSSPALLINLLDILCERLRWVSESVEDYALLTLHSRLARRLLALRDNFGDATGTIAISQSDLADFAGATREATNKILMEWKSLGMIEVGRRSIRLTNLKKIEDVSHSQDG